MKNTAFTLYSLRFHYGPFCECLSIEFDGEGEFRRVLEETSNKSTTLILAADRTHRRDPLNGFNYYTGGWSLNDHYFSVSPFKLLSLF